ncbi:MAG: efflux RND transporter permease subunit [Opitutales bacterium]|nr:efflux RND transporter permease subunit [Opitutales bacterium]MCH8539594.1 efflux RND transporter permease subunit [Opitutales bacterium]
MMQGLTRWVLRNNRTATLFFLLIAFAGGWSFWNLPRLEDPDFTIRNAVVLTAFPGAAPVRVEELVTDPVEEAIRQIGEVEEVKSQSLAGMSIVTVSVYERYFEMQPIWNRLRNQMDDLQPDLPEGVMPPKVIDDFGDVFGIIIALRGEGFRPRELEDEADRVRESLRTVPGVAKVELHGVQEERIFVDVYSPRLAEFGFSPYQLATLLDAQNTLQPTGSVVAGPERILLESTGEFTSLTDIRRASFRLPEMPESIFLEDLAQITRSYEDPPGPMTRFNGEEAIFIAVSMVDGGNIVDLGNRIQKTMAGVEQTLPWGMEWDFVTYQPKFVQRAINDFMSSLLQAFLFVLVVMFLAAGWRLGLIVGLLVPTAMLACLALMPLFGIDLQQVSIASLIIALGLLVDNAVVVSEKILRRMEEGMKREEAISDVVGQVASPLLVASFTTVCAFLPIALARSIVAEYTFSLFVVVTLTLVASWFLSLTLVPFLGYYLLKARTSETNTATEEGKDPSAREKQQDKQANPPTLAGGRAYQFLLRQSLRFRWPILAGVFLLVGLATLAFFRVPTIFFPPNEREILVVDFWQPYGTDIEATGEAAKELEEILLDKEEVRRLGVFVGTGGPRWYLALEPEQNFPNYAFFLLETEKLAQVDPLMRELRAVLRDEFPDTRGRVSRLEQGPPVGAPIQLRFRGAEMEELYRLRNWVEEEIQGISGIQNIRDDWGEWTKKLVIDVDQDRVQRAGLTSRDVALSLRSHLQGFPASQFREGDRVIPILVRSSGELWRNPERLGGAELYSFQTGVNVPLEQVAETRMEWQASNIRRRDQKRTMTLEADVEGRYPSDVLEEILPILAELQAGEDWPLGYEVEIGGEDEESAKAQRAILAVMPLAMALLVLALIFQFNSFRRAAIIILTLPPMMIGITLGLWLTGSPFGFMALLGMISLLGIIVNNAIVMIDTIESERARLDDLQEALFSGAGQRVRPILMSATTTVLCLIPLAVQGGEMWRPMAVVIIFGLALATLFTLILCPLLYSLFFRISKST